MVNLENFTEIVRANRSFRKFHQHKRIHRDQLRRLVNLARLSPSARNLQPLKYVLLSEPEETELVFPHLAWAGYLDDFAGPEEGERPAAYIFVLGDHEISENFGIDPGIAAQSILLGAVSEGWGGCMLGSVNRTALQKCFQIPEQYEIILVIALGVPKEHIQLDQKGDEGGIRYWRDEQGVHHVPKRSLDEILLSLEPKEAQEPNSSEIQRTSAKFSE